MISPVGSVVPSYCPYDVYISKDDVPAQLGERKLDPQNERLHTLQRLKLQTTRLSVAMGQSHPQVSVESLELISSLPCRCCQFIANLHSRYFGPRHTTDCLDEPR